MSDGVPRLASLSVIGGPLHGKRVDLAGVDEVTIGADADCSLVVELPGVSPLHAKVWVDLDGAKVIDTRSPSGVFVNMDRVEGERALREGDTVWLGGWLLSRTELRAAALVALTEPASGAR